jgi:two-component system sensor kinase FixL
MLRHRDQEIREDQAHLTRVVMMGEMASIIAHEVNQPLTAIANYAHACHRLIDSGNIGDNETKATLERISKQAIRAGAIIHSLKDLSEKRLAKHEESDINSVVLDIQPLMQLDARVRDARLHLELGDSLPSLTIDRVQIQQVIFNLVRNAIDAMADTPTEQREVALSTHVTPEGDIEVRVADHGCGLPDCEEERMYESFFTTKKGGMGLGLSVSRKILASHGGQLEHRENEGGGTVFYFTLPPATGGVHGS